MLGDSHVCPSENMFCALGEILPRHYRWHLLRANTKLLGVETSNFLSNFRELGGLQL